MITEPGIYTGVPMEEYLEIPAVSASLLKTITDRCPAAARHESHLNPNRERDFNKAKDRGTIGHAILLEGTEDCCAVIDPEDHPSETKPYGIPDGWTNKSIKYGRDEARNAGKIPVLVKDMAAIRTMVAAAIAKIESVRESEPAIWSAFQRDGGRSEVIMVWKEGDTLCRMRPDRISNDNRVVIDPKFARTAEPDAFGKTGLMGMGYSVSAAFYRRGIRALCGVDAEYIFFPIETDPPHLPSFVGCNPMWLEYGDSIVRTGLRMWEKCFANDRWPAYPARVAYPDMPPWLMAQWEGRQASDGFGIPYDLDDVFTRKETA